MKPDPTLVLEAAAAALSTELGPRFSELGEAFTDANVQIYAMLLLSVREEFDRAASRRVDENRAMRAIFAEAAGLVGDAGLAARLRAAAESEDGSLAVPDLDRGNRELRSLLTELHARVEAEEGAAARELERKIWLELLASTERRRLALGVF